jgi:hypothetical protein
MSPEDLPDDLVPASVRLGNVVPPEDPEDWTRPLTWAVALGILGAPLLAAGWFILAPAADPEQGPAPWVLAATLAAGAALTGSTQIGRLRAGTATLGAGLLGALLLVVVATSMPGNRSVAGAYPIQTQAIRAAAAGIGGVLPACALAPLLARMPSRGLRFALPGLLGAAVALLIVPFLS